MQPSPIHKGPFRVIGIAVRTSNPMESNPETGKIPGLWGRFFQENLLSQIPAGSADAAVVGAYVEYESDHNGEYTLIAGRVSDPNATAPTGMTSFDFPEQDYLMFEDEGPMPQCVIDTWMEIWRYFDGSDASRRSYVADFEEYDASGSGVKIYVGVEST